MHFSDQIQPKNGVQENREQPDDRSCTEVGAFPPSIETVQAIGLGKLCFDKVPQSKEKFEGEIGKSDSHMKGCLHPRLDHQTVCMKAKESKGFHTVQSH